MQIKTKSGRLLELPTPEEDAAINAGIAADPDNPELDDGWFDRAQPAQAFYDEKTYAGLVELSRRGKRGPQKAPTKERITIRLSRDVVASFRATGDGWQARLDAALKDWLQSHTPA